MVGRVELIHALSSESTARQIDARSEQPQGVLVEVNTAADPSKEGVAPSDLDAFLELLAGLADVRVEGLMTMPAFAEDPEASRPAFAALRELAAGAAGRWAGTHSFERPVDGHEPGLRRGGGRGSHRRPARQRALRRSPDRVTDGLSTLAPHGSS